MLTDSLAAADTTLFDPFTSAFGENNFASTASDADTPIQFHVQIGQRSLDLISYERFRDHFWAVLKVWTGLEDGWAGEGSVAPTLDTVCDCLGFLSRVPPNLPAPRVAPADDGELLLEWDEGDHSAAIVSFVGDGTYAYALKEDGQFVAGREPGRLDRPTLPDDLYFRLEDIAQGA